jgi:hypothetical protein
MSVIRLHTLYASGTSTDPTWDKLPSGYCAQLEVNLGIVCACVVTLKPLFHQSRGLLSSNNSQESGVGSRPTMLRHHIPDLNNIPTVTESNRALCDSRDVQLSAMDNYRSLTGSSATDCGSWTGQRALDRASEPISRNSSAPNQDSTGKFSIV